MPRRGENIYKRKDGRWEGRYIASYRDDGRANYRSIYGKTYAEVKAKLNTCRELQRKGMLQDCKLTVNELLAIWLSDREATVKASSYARYTMLAEKHITPILGKLAVCDLTTKRLEAFIVEKQRKGRLDRVGGLSPKMVADILFVLKSALKLAKRQYGYVDARGIMEVRAPAAPRNRVETFGEFETAKMSRILQSSTTISDASYLLCLNTGLRLGELCGLRWSDLNYNEKELRISRTAQRIKTENGTKLVVQTPKSKASERTIPLQSELFQFITSFRRNASLDSYILTGNTQPMEPRTMQYRFKRFLINNGLTVRNFHVLRHSFATRCISMGMDAKCLSEILGHSNIKITLQLYVHPTMIQKRAMMQAVSTMKQTA